MQVNLRLGRVGVGVEVVSILTWLRVLTQPNNNNPNAADGWDLLVMSPRLLAAAHLHRWAASVTGCRSSLKIVGLCSGVSEQET
jgi:hypothetical protein